MSAAKRLRIAAMLASPPQSPARKPDVAIRDVRAYAIREPDSGRSWVTVVVETESGVKGYGECAASPDPEAARVSLLRHRADLVGQDALANVAMDRLLQLAPAEVRAAVDMALLDIKGKQLKAPIYELLSGRTRDKVRGLAVLGSNDAALGEARSAGFRAFSVPLQIPSGPTRGRAFYAQTYQRVSSLRRDGEDFVLDCTGSTTAAQAGVLAAEFEKFHLLWLDEPAGDINEEALRKISGTVTPLGWGRSMADNGELQDLLRMQVIDVFRPDITRLGFSRARRGAALAEAYYTGVAIYHRCGPVSTAAAIQLAASLPNSFSVDVPMPAGDRDRGLRTDLGGAAVEKATDGFIALPQAPGLGIEVNEDALRQHAA
jgi:galactonate dehydratase